ncbi:MAG: hypothetical protein ABJP90_20095 [Paracoccaceae bacterium]
MKLNYTIHGLVNHFESLTKIIKETTQFNSLRNFEVESIDPLSISENGMELEYVGRLSCINEYVIKLSKTYAISKQFISEWITYMLLGTFNEVIDRIVLIEKITDRNLNDIFNNERKIKYLEDEISTLKSKDTHFNGIQYNLTNYDFHKIDFLKMSYDHTIYFFTEQMDGIIYPALEVHANVLYEIYPDDPIIYFDDEWEVGSSNLKSFVTNLTSYFKLIHLRELASNLEENSLTSLKTNKLTTKDLQFTTLILQIIKTPDHIKIIEDILLKTSKRNASFFQNLHTKLSKEKRLNNFFIYPAPNTYLEIVNKCYPNLNLSRSTPSKPTHSLIAYIEKSIDNYLTINV